MIEHKITLQEQGHIKEKYEFPLRVKDLAERKCQKQVNASVKLEVTRRMLYRFPISGAYLMKLIIYISLLISQSEHFNQLGGFLRDIIDD
jgi:hypothetical protein